MPPLPPVRRLRRVLGAVAFALAGAAAAQTPAPSSPLSPRRLPPLPDSLRLYGTALAVRTPLPDLAPPADAPLLILGEAVRRALVVNPRRQIAVLDAAVAAGDATRANAGYLPDVDASASLGGSRSGGTGRASDGTGSGRTSSSLGGGVTVGYTLFDGDRRAATLARLRANARATAFESDAVSEALVRDVVAAYLDVVREQLAVGTREETVAVSEDRLRIEQARVSIGISAPVDAALALADLNADRAALLSERLRLRQARRALAELVALDVPDVRVATDTTGLLPAGTLPTATLAGGAADAFVPPDVRALEADERVAAAAVREVASEFLPTLRFTTGLGLTTSAADWLPIADEAGSLDLRYGFSASLPLFDGGDRARRLEAARVRVAQAELRTDAARRAQAFALAQLRDTREGYRALLDLETQNRAVARQNVRVALAQQELGLLSSLDLRQIQLALVAAEQRRLDALYTLLDTEAELRYRTGAFRLDLLDALGPYAPPRPRGTQDPFDLRTYLPEQ